VRKRRDNRLIVIVSIGVALAAFGYAIDRSADKTSGSLPLPALSEADEHLVHQGFQQAVAMLHAKEYEHAVQSLHKVLSLRPAMPEAHVNMGYALLGLDNAAVARDFFDTATVLRPSQFNAYFGLAVANEALGNLAAAVGAMRTYVHLAPQDDPYRIKAEAAIWEWQSALSQEMP